MARRERTPQELTLASEHVADTVERLFGSLRDCLELQRAHYSGASTSRWTRQALFDCWAVQLRNTMHFLRATSPQPTDILASDYFPGERWRELLAQSDAKDWPAMLDEVTVKGWIDSELLRLGYERIHAAPEAKTWPLALITAHLGADIQAFLDNVASELVAEDFTVRVQNALDSLR